MPIGYVLGFDFGLKHIGVSIGQFVTRTASGLTTLRAHDGNPDWKAISRLISEWHPSVIVVGLPINMDGSESEMSQRARDFADQLARRYGLSVNMVDERLSSREARGMDPDHDHEIAAALIAQTWLNGCDDP